MTRFICAKPHIACYYILYSVLLQYSTYTLQYYMYSLAQSVLLYCTYTPLSLIISVSIVDYQHHNSPFEL